MTTGNRDFSSGDTVDTTSWSGEDDPIYKRRINPFGKSRTFQYNPWATIYDLSGNPEMSKINGRWFLLTSEEELELKFKLAAKTADAIRQHRFNLAVTAAEFGKTISLIADSARGIATIFEGILGSAIVYSEQKRRLYKRRAKRGGSNNTNLREDLLSTQEFIQQRWLEARYGWRPLLSDAYNAGEAAASLLNSPSPWSRATSKVKAPLAFTIMNYNQLFKYGEGEKSVLLKFRRLGDASIPEHLGLKDPLSIIWELIPYSFVIDWFAPVGGFLSAYETLTSAVGYETLMTERTRISVNGVDVQGDGNKVGKLPYRERSYTFARSSPSLQSLEHSQYVSMHLLDTYPERCKLVLTT